MEKQMNNFFDNYDDCFYKYVSDIFVNLRKNNKHYQEFSLAESELLNQFPKIRRVIEDEESYDLTKEEVNAFIKVLSLKDSKKMLEEKELFFKGGKEAYYYFTKMGIIKK